jgi:hypothetical protein
MATIDVFQGCTRTLALSFTNEGDGSPLNVSGFLVQFVAKQSYSQALAQAIVNTTVTGVAPEAITGLIYLPITTGDTSHCVGDYFANFKVTDLMSGVSPFSVDGYRILPTTTYPNA